MSGPIDNSELVASLIDPIEDGDTFWYTEVLDRTKRAAGDNRKRVVRMYRHACRADLLEVMPQIRALCDATGARAYTRLSPRSHKAVARELLRLTADMVASEQWNSAAYLYARACGRTNIHVRRLWLYDVDKMTPEVLRLHEYLIAHGLLRAEIPSRKGVHYIAVPHDPRGEPRPFDVQLHKDNPTNLYISVATEDR